ncbi:hypothetical protein Tco_1465670 [Tanacetum coccineum]
MADQDTPPPTITAIKIPIIKKGEYDIWSTISPPVPKTAKQLDFGGYQESKGKECSKNIQFEDFVTASNETLDKAYDRFQKLINIDEVDIVTFTTIFRVYEDELKGLQVPNLLFSDWAFAFASEILKIFSDGWRMILEELAFRWQDIGGSGGVGGYDWSNEFEVEPVQN